MKRRQIQVGSPFEEAQSILGDPLWLVNYAIQVPNQPFPDPPKPIVSQNVPLQPPVKELTPLQDTDFRENFLQEIEATKKVEEIPVVQNQIQQQNIVQREKSPEKPNPVNTQQSRAQQLIQQSQQLLSRRRGNLKQNNVNEKQQNEPIQEQIKQEEQIHTQIIQQKQQPQIEQKIQNIQKVEEQPINNSPPPQTQQINEIQVQQNIARQNPPVRNEKQVQQSQIIPKTTQQVQAQQTQQIQKQQSPIAQQQQQVQQKTKQSIIYSSTFYHGLTSYDYQQNQLIKISTSSIVSQYPGPFFKNKSPDNLRSIRYFWASYKTDNALLQLAIDHLEKQVEKNSALQIIESKVLNDSSGIAFVNAYERINNSQDWETKLLVGLLMGETINLKQQQSLIEYIKKRTYQDDQEAWLIRLAVLLKMVPMDQEYYSEILIQLQHLYSSEQIQARLLWLLFKLEIQNTNLEIFLLSYFTRLNYNLCNSEVQILLGDSHMYFHNQQNAELYYKLSLLFVESQNYEKALECAKFSIDLGFQNKGRDLRDRILQVIELKEKNKTQNTNNQNSGLFGYLGQAVNAVKNIQKQPQQENQVYQPQPQNFYYDKELKAYVINGVPQLAQPEEEQKKEVIVAPPPPRRKIDQPKPIVNEEEQIVQQQHEITEDPFATQQQQHQSEHNKKKNSLLRNRYVQ